MCMNIFPTVLDSAFASLLLINIFYSNYFYTWHLLAPLLCRFIEENCPSDNSRESFFLNSSDADKCALCTLHTQNDNVSSETF